MILTCPACNARFVIEAVSVGRAGRQVRCGVCSHAWHQAPESDEAEELEEIDDEEMLEDYADDDDAPAAEGFGFAAEDGGQERLSRLEAFDEERRRSDDLRGGFEAERKGLSIFTVAWIALVVFLGALAGIAWFGREALIAQFPEAAKLYAKVGIAVEKPQKLGEGLELRDVNSAKREIDGKRTLMIEGMVVNVSERTMPVPALRAVITDAEGGQISEWTFTPDTDSLPPGGRVAFQTSTEDPERGVNLSLIFVER